MSSSLLDQVFVHFLALLAGTRVFYKTEWRENGIKFRYSKLGYGPSAMHNEMNTTKAKTK